MESSDKMFDVFDMLVNRLTNIEIQNNKIITQLKCQCIQNKFLTKDLFEYPLNLTLEPVNYVVLCESNAGLVYLP